METTDLEKLQRLFNELGIVFSMRKEDEFILLELEVKDELEEVTKVHGYSGFISTYFFNTNGSFKRVNIWE